MQSIWKRSAVVALPLGLLLGLPLPLLLYLSDVKDFGRLDYANYWDFAWRYSMDGALEVLATVAVVWLLCVGTLWLIDKTKARQA